MEKVFVIIKPDALKRDLVGWIVSKFENVGLSVVSMLSRRQGPVWCSQHYKHLSLHVYARVAPFMLSDVLIGVVFEGNDAIEIARRVAGDFYNPAFGTIRFRARARGALHENLVHVSDSVDNTNRETVLFWR